MNLIWSFPKRSPEYVVNALKSESYTHLVKDEFVRLEKWAGFDPNVEHLPPIMSNCDLSDVRMAPGADHGIR